MPYTLDPDRLRRLKPAVTIAEIAGNHGGDFDTACRMIAVAAACGADYAKFQKRDVEALPESIKGRERNDQHAFGPNEYEHRKALEFSIEQHARLKEVCEAHGIRYACSAWDERSYNELAELGLDYIKIPSARNTDWERWKRNHGDVPLHISLGLTTGGERDRLLRDHAGGFALPRTVFYGCTSTYPCENQDSYLLEIPYLLERGGDCGFSGHHRGIQLDVAAYLLGAGWIERHFTLDRTSKGTDHAASLEPAGFTRLVRDLAAVRSALKSKPHGLPVAEELMRKKLKGV